MARPRRLPPYPAGPRASPSHIQVTSAVKMGYQRHHLQIKPSQVATTLLQTQLWLRPAASLLVLYKEVSEQHSLARPEDVNDAVT